MKLDLNLTEHFTEPIEQVWHAITDSQMLALWLMENNFEARVGARFVLRRLDPPRGWRGWVECEVLELQKPNRMVWSWSDGAEQGEPTRVIFELCTEDTGTRLTIRHLGYADDAVGKMICERWPIKLRALASMLGERG